MRLVVGMRWHGIPYTSSCKMVVSLITVIWQPFYPVKVEYNHIDGKRSFQLWEASPAVHAGGFGMSH